MKDCLLTALKFAMCICRYIFGDRNMRYWQISKLPAEILANAITNEDQQKKPSKGRPRCLNNKNPGGVLLFKSIFCFFCLFVLLKNFHFRNHLQLSFQMHLAIEE